MNTAKSDTRLLLDGDLEADLSQWDTDMTGSGASSYEEASARTALDGSGFGRTIEVFADLAQGSNRLLVDHGGSGSAKGYAIQIKSGLIKLLQAGVAIGELAPPNLGVGATGFLVVWATEPNPATTGPSDELRSELLIVDVENLEVARGIYQHARVEPSPLEHFAVNGTWDGTTINNASAEPLAGVRISSRFHTTVEAREDWADDLGLVALAEPDGDALRLAEPARLAAAAHELGEVAGPQYQAVALGLAEMRPRAVGAVVQATSRERPTLGADWRDTWGTKWVRDMADGFQASRAWCWVRRLAETCAWLKVRMQVALWPLGTNDPAPLTIAVCCSGERPGTEDAEVSRVEVERTTDDGTDGLGALLDFELLLIRRGLEDGRTWIWVEAKLTGDDADATAYAIRSCSIAPLALPSIDDELAPIDGYGP